MRHRPGAAGLRPAPGATISLALTRLPATGPGRRIGSIFFNPGGPGGSGRGLLQAIGRDLYSDEVRARFDLVSFDPRGSPAAPRCSASRPPTTPWPPWHRSRSRSPGPRSGSGPGRPDLRPGLRGTGRADPDHMSTANVARDMDLLRRAVGDRKMTYVGYSYGTAIGSTYANMFPDKVRAVVIDGVTSTPSPTPPAGRPGQDAALRRPPAQRAGRLRHLRRAPAALRPGRVQLRSPAATPSGATTGWPGGCWPSRPSCPTTRAARCPSPTPTSSTPPSGRCMTPSSWPPFGRVPPGADTPDQPGQAAEDPCGAAARLGCSARAPYEQVLEGFAGALVPRPRQPRPLLGLGQAARRADRRDPTSAGPGSGSAASAHPG